MRVLEFSSRALAEKARADDEVVVAVRTAGAWRFGLLPAQITVDTPTGPRSQPVWEFLGGYWETVEREAAKKVGVQ